MNTKKIDYLKFNSESIKKLIIRKLSENQYFTDQVFDDSNLAILIDCFAAMFETSIKAQNKTMHSTVFTTAINHCATHTYLLQQSINKTNRLLIRSKTNKSFSSRLHCGP